MSNNDHFSSHLEQFQIAVLTTTYVIFCLAFISWFILPGYIYPLFKGVTTIIMTMVFIVIFVVFGAVLYVLFRIPFHLQYSFDDIKNRIANGSIATIGELEKELSDFIIQFFDFAFFDIEECAIQIRNRKIFFSSDHLQGLLNYDEMAARAVETQKSIRVGKIRYQSGKYHVLLVPVWFGEEWYGYILVFSKTRFIPFTREILEDFENNFIDDQIIHVHRLETAR